MGQSFSPTEEDYRRLFHTRKLNSAFKCYLEKPKEDTEKEISLQEEYVIKQLMELTLLNEVPFNYLVPYEKNDSSRSNTFLLSRSKLDSGYDGWSV